MSLTPIHIPEAMARGGKTKGEYRYPLASKDNWYGEADYEQRGGKLVEMTPDEFLSKVKSLSIDQSSRDNIDDLKKHIQEGGELDPLTIYSLDKTLSRNSDGRHRAIAAKELGINKVPVIDYTTNNSFQKGGETEKPIWQQTLNEYNGGVERKPGHIMVGDRFGEYDGVYKINQESGLLRLSRGSQGGTVSVSEIGKPMGRIYSIKEFKDKFGLEPVGVSIENDRARYDNPAFKASNKHYAYGRNAKDLIEDLVFNQDYHIISRDEGRFGKWWLKRSDGINDYNLGVKYTEERDYANHLIKYRDAIQDAIKLGKYEQAIKGNIMSVDEVINIISQVKLSIPSSISDLKDSFKQGGIIGDNLDIREDDGDFIVYDKITGKDLPHGLIVDGNRFKTRQKAEQARKAFSYLLRFKEGGVVNVEKLNQIKSNPGVFYNFSELVSDELLRKVNTNRSDLSNVNIVYSDIHAHNATFKILTDSEAKEIKAPSGKIVIIGRNATPRTIVHELAHIVRAAKGRSFGKNEIHKFESSADRLAYGDLDLKKFNKIDFLSLPYKQDALQYAKLFNNRKIRSVKSGNKYKNTLFVDGENIWQVSTDLPIENDITGVNNILSNYWENSSLKDNLRKSENIFKEGGVVGARFGYGDQVELKEDFSTSKQGSKGFVKNVLKDDGGEIFYNLEGVGRGIGITGLQRVPEKILILVNQDVKEKIEKHLDEKQAKKEFKDVGKRVTGSKKEKRAYSTISIGDLSALELDELTAHELVTKDKVYPELNILEQKEMGVSSGAAFLKVEIRKACGAKPPNNKEKRRAYVTFIDRLTQGLKDIKTVDEVVMYLDTLRDSKRPAIDVLSLFFEEFANPTPEQAELATLHWKTKFGYKTPADILRYTIVEVFGKRFENFIFFRSESALEARQQARLYEPISQDQEDKYRAEHTDRFNKIIADQQGKVEKYKNYSLAELRDDISNWSGMDQYRKAKDYEGFRQAAIRYYERKLNESKTALDSFPESKKVRAEDWSWFEGAKEKKEIKKSGEVAVNTWPPLHYIKRTGGLVIPPEYFSESKNTDPDKNPITTHYGFKSVQYGNALKNSEAREHIRHFLAGVTDLAEILNINIEDLNSIGGLSIAFAARGSRGASAHYERGRCIINITNSKGDGALAHEFAHYIDNAITMSANKTSLNYGSQITEKKYVSGRTEVTSHISYAKTEAAMLELMNFIWHGKEGITPKLNKWFNRAIPGQLLFVSGKPVPVSDKIERYYDDQDKMFVNLEKYGNSAQEMINYLWPRCQAIREFNYRDPYKQALLIGRICDMFDIEGISIPYTVKGKSSYYYNSSHMSSKYWIEPWELVARAWETYIFDKLASKGRISNYLVNGEWFNTDLSTKTGVTTYVYPTGAERAYFAGLFDSWVKAIKEDFKLRDFKPSSDIREDEYISLEEKKENGGVFEKGGQTDWRSDNVKQGSMKENITSLATFFKHNTKYSSDHYPLTRYAFEIDKPSANTVYFRTKYFGDWKDNIQVSVTNGDDFFRVSQHGKTEKTTDFKKLDNMLAELHKEKIAKYGNYLTDQYSSDYDIQNELIGQYAKGGQVGSEFKTVDEVLNHINKGGVFKYSSPLNEKRIWSIVKDERKDGRYVLSSNKLKRKEMLNVASLTNIVNNVINPDFEEGGEVADNSISKIEDTDIFVYVDKIKKVFSFVGDGVYEVDLNSGFVSILFDENPVGGIPLSDWNKAEQIMTKLNNNNGIIGYYINSSDNKIEIEFDWEEYSVSLDNEFKIGGKVCDCYEDGGSVQNKIDNDIIEFVGRNSYLEFDSNENGVLSFSTRKNGSVGDEQYGQADLNEAKTLSKKLHEKFPSVSTKIEIVDEWVSVLVRQKLKNQKDEYTYRFIKHSKPNHRDPNSHGFSEVFDSFSLLKRKYKSWLPKVDFLQVKNSLNKINQFPRDEWIGYHSSTPLLIAEPNKNGNKWGYYFSIEKRKKNKPDLFEQGGEIDDEQEVELNSFADPNRYKSEIKKGDRYFDNRYQDYYTVGEILSIPSTKTDAKVVLQYDKGKTRTESASFILYHIDQRQHSLAK